MRWNNVLAIVGALGLAVIPATGQAASRADGAAAHRTWATAPLSINLFAHSNLTSRGSVAHKTKPFMQPTIARSRQSRRAPIVSLPALQSTSPLLTQVASFPLISFDAQVSLFGLDQAAEPPDTMLAAGPTSLLEMVNSNASIWSKSGNRIAIADLNNALPMPSGFTFSDPRVLFDATSRRFFFIGVGFSLTFNSLVFLGVSKTSDPAGGFVVYKLAQTSNGELHDQPKIGMSDDKVVISWNEFCCGFFGIFRGAETFVLEKSTLLTGSPTPVYFVGPNLGQSSPVPAQSLSSTTTEYVTFNHNTFTGVLAITGTPAQNNVVITETDLSMPATSMPPKAVQPEGTINTNDDRFLSSIWQNGVLWTTGNTGCIPSGSPSTRSCMRLVQVSTSPTVPTLMQAYDIGRAGIDAYYPAVTMDPAGDLFVSLTASSSSLFPSAAALEVAFGAPPGTISGASVFQLGAKTYGGTRWGDYSAISVDPATGAIWAAAEYSAAGSSRNWGTATAAFTP
jgi:hypothetical protein